MKSIQTIEVKLVEILNFETKLYIVIKYKLFCGKCSQDFDSWFASSKEFEKLKKTAFINCPNCNSLKIEKSLMAPSIINNKKENKNLNSNNHSEIKKKLKEYKNFVKNNFEYVGDNFTYEARSIHYSKDNKTKGIYGRANSEEISELRDEGIESEVIPWFKDNEN